MLEQNHACEDNLKHIMAASWQSRRMADGDTFGIDSRNDDTVMAVMGDIQDDNPWAGTPYEAYARLTPSGKTPYSERLVRAKLSELGHDVGDRLTRGDGTPDASHDCTIANADGTVSTVEIKFGLATKRNTDWRTIYNHIGLDKNWDYIVLCCVNGDCRLGMSYYTRRELPMGLLRRQQGGKAEGNDDFMCIGANSRDLLLGGHALL